MSSNPFSGCKPPFESELLDSLLDSVGLDVVVVTSKHGIQYLLGGYRFHFNQFMDAIGLSRYLPALVYRKGRVDQSAYFGSALEADEEENFSFWVPKTDFSSMTSPQCASAVAKHLDAIGCARSRIGVEKGYLPADAYRRMQEQLPDATVVDASFQVEILRARKSAAELELLRTASAGVVDAILTTFARLGPGCTKRDLVASVREEEHRRGLDFEYCLASIGESFNRSPSDQVWNGGEVVCLDSGGRFDGYIGDLARMCVDGEPDDELQEALGLVDEIQQAARKPVRSGVQAAEIHEGPGQIIRRSRFRNQLDFVAHGMGIVSHEAPWLTDRGPVPYEAYHADRPLEAGMVLSIETTLFHPTRGFIKLEDTVAVTEDGHEAYGDWGRGWN